MSNVQNCLYYFFSYANKFGEFALELFIAFYPNNLMTSYVEIFSRCVERMAVVSRGTEWNLT